MNFRTRAMAVLAVTFSMVSAAASASTISMTAFSAQGWVDATAGAIVETFETPALGTAFAAGPFTTSGELGPQGYGSAVGHFTTAGGRGTGTQCRTYFASGSACEQIALQDDTLVRNGRSVAEAHGQGNIAPDLSGQFSLSSADTLGLVWQVKLGQGRMFDRIVFALRDPADAGRRTLDILLNGRSLFGAAPPTRLGNGATWLVDIGLADAAESAEIRILTSRNDGFTFDGAAVVPTSMPLPGSVLMLMAAMGGLFVLRRRLA